jgi:hemin uptake protein HemP
MSVQRAGARPDDASTALTSGAGAFSALSSPRDDRAPIDVRSLLGGAREATLMLDGEAYKLRITAKEKLILTK